MPASTEAGQHRRMFEILAQRSALTAAASMKQVVDAVHQMPYGRPAQRTVLGALAEWRGTCSTKHALLAAVLTERWPQTSPQLVHRVYHGTPEQAGRNFGPRAACVMPVEGLWDVHRYLTAEFGGNRIAIDVTFPWGPAWDGAGSMPIACGPGTDHVAGRDPDADKRALESAYCDPAVREPFIAALSEV